MWIDTHLHLDAPEYDHDRESVVQRARAQHVNRFVLPAVGAFNFDTVKALAKAHEGSVYCLGIHPLFVEKATLADLQVLETKVAASMNDPQFAGIGEIGLDGFVPGLNTAKQTEFFHAQLKIARDFDLPVVMHVRKAQDPVLKALRIYKPRSGIAHAFNGSFQQAEYFLKLGMCLGFGGACTFDRALQLQRLARELPSHGIVLETDGPDIAPAWIYKQRNAPEHLPRIANHIASLRHMAPAELAAQCAHNSEKALPALSRVR